MHYERIIDIKTKGSRFKMEKNSPKTAHNSEIQNKRAKALKIMNRYIKRWKFSALTYDRSCAWKNIKNDVSSQKKNPRPGLVFGGD